MRGKKMKHKIYLQFCLIAALAILVTTTIVTALFYQRFKAQVFSDVRTYAYVLTSVDTYDEATLIQEVHQLDNLRVTIIDKEGKVLLDTNADIGGMENHSNREEIKAAFETGEGQAVRQSKTVAKSTFYYAVRMNDGNVLRVATETGSVLSIVQGMLPIIAVMVIILFVICTFLGRLLTDSLLRPIEQMAKNMDYVNEISVYQEMEPFIDTIRRQHEDILKNASMRQDFTANVSHELKTPLAAISGYSELIENGMVSEKDIARFGGEIHKSADRLLTLINDTIRLSELDATTQDVVLETVDLYQAAENCMDTLEISAQKHDVTLKLEGVPCKIRTEKGMADEVIYNLCDNAIRYNNKGGSVTISVLPVDNQVVLSVKDTGIGISKVIERKRRGLGRPSLIYVKDFTTGLSKMHNLNCANSNSGVAQSAVQEPPKPQANKTDKNNTEMNKPDPIHSGDIREQLVDYFYQVLEVELLLRLFPDDEDTIYQIVDLLVDPCATKRKLLRIAGDDKPAEVVRSRLKKLNADHIRFVLNSLAENATPVRNMKQYLLASLYNAPTTMNLPYQNMTNHDFAHGSRKVR